MRITRTLCSLALAAGFALSGCKTPGSSSKALTPEQEERAAEVIEWTSQGAVPRSGRVEVKFVKPWAADDEVGKDADGKWIDVDGLDGRLWWKDNHTLVFDPEDDLKPGKIYDATLDLPGLTGDPTMPTYPFSFAAAMRTATFAGAGWKESGTTATAVATVSFSEAPSDTASTAKAFEATQDGDELKSRWTWTGPASARVEIDGVRIGGPDLQLELDNSDGGIDDQITGSMTPPKTARTTAPVWVEGFTNNGRDGFRVLLANAPENSTDLRGLLEIQGTSVSPDFELDGQMARVSWPAKGENATLVVTTGSQEERFSWSFSGLKPSVDWSETGAILTSKAEDQIHFKAINLEKVRVRVARVSPGNVPEFLDDNKLDEAREARRRPGRIVWDRIISLQARPDEPLEGTLDLGRILESQGAGMYTIELERVRDGMLYRCDDSAADESSSESSEGDEDGEGEYEDSWSNRDNPCKDAYWHSYWSPTARRNVVVSDLGLMAWREPTGRVVAVASDLLTAEPWKGIEIEALGVDDGVQASGTTSSEGFVELPGARSAVVLHAKGERDGRQMHAWLRLRDGEARNLSRFDVGGQTRPDGIRLFPWSERGVYRPGDSVFIGCLVRGPDGRSIDRLPLRLTLRDPRGRVAGTTVVRAAPEAMFSWRTATRVEDPTGRWTLTAEAGPATSELPILVETIRPNRLKINVTAPPVVGEGADGADRVKLSSHWLSGGLADGLRAEVQIQTSPAPFSPKGLSEFTFTDPTRPADSDEPEERIAWEGQLDSRGEAEFALGTSWSDDAPGLLQASLRTRVFEPGGQASVDRFTVLLSPYASYAGLHLRNADSWVQTGTKVGIEVVSVTPQGQKVPRNRLQIEVWRHPETWWWEDGDNMRNFLNRSGVEKVWSGEALSGSTTEFSPSSSGRYAILVKDPSGHAAGRFVSAWDGWGSAPSGSGASPSQLTLKAERDTVSPDGPMSVSFPSSKGAKALVQILDGRRILSQEWVSTKDEQTVWKGKAPKGVRGGLYVQVSLLQPYPPSSDRPLRMWGVVPLVVSDASTRLSPVIESPAEIRPQTKAKIRIREAGSKPMRVMLAIVDEGLLDLTRFKTPDPWQTFHGREALQIQGWDLFDQVVGAWAGRTDRLFAVGGSEDARKKAAQSKGNPFPPMVLVKGPFDVPAKGTDVEVDIPRYTGSVRMMVVAAKDEAFGSAEKAVFVRAPVMALLTVPRALSPSDRAVIPVTVFASKPGRVQVKAKLTGPIAAEGNTTQWVDFREAGDRIVNFAVRATNGTGQATIVVDATSPAGSGSDAQAFQVRQPGVPGTRSILLAANDSLTWSVPLTPWGLEGTRTARLEISSTGLIGLHDRVQDLITYPHGCLEQTLSGLVPQIFLRTLVPWSAESQLKTADANVRAGLDRLRLFQTPSGGLSLWPGEGEPYPWGTLWAVRGMLAAREAGFDVPASLLDPVVAWIASKAAAFRPGSEARRGDTLAQVTRLDLLALAGKPDLAAMNRLREAPLGDLERWTLAAAYATAGRTDVANKLAAKAGAAVSDVRMTDHWLNSPLRDRALLAEAMSRAGARAKSVEQTRLVRDDLRRSAWYSTQELGAAFYALARLQGKATAKDGFGVRWRLDQGPWKAFKVTGGTGRVDLPADHTGSLEVKVDNRVAAEAFLSLRAVPGPEEPVPAPNGLELTVTYERADGSSIDPARLEQGEDFRVVTTVRNRSGRYQPNLALTQIFPGGWEIRNENIEGAETPADAPKPTYWWGSATTPRRVEIRDDRALHYLDLPYDGVSRVVVGIRAAYVGSYIRPGAQVENLYDATWQATQPSGRSEITAR